MTVTPFFRRFARGALLAALIVAPSSAQMVGGSLRNYDKKAPIDFSADRIEVLEKQSQALFTGSVQVSQGDLDLTAASVRVDYTGGDDLTVNTLTAEGGVTVKTPAERAQAARAIYDVPKSLVTLIGNVRLTRGTDTLTGERLVIDLNSGRSSIAAASGNGRVTGRFIPETD